MQDTNLTPEDKMRLYLDLCVLIPIGASPVSSVGNWFDCVYIMEIGDLAYCIIWYDLQIPDNDKKTTGCTQKVRVENIAGKWHVKKRG